MFFSGAFVGWEKLQLLFTCLLNAFNWMSLPSSASTHPTLQIFLIKRTFCAPLLSLHPLLILLKSTGWSVASGKENHSIRLHRWNESQEVGRKEERKKRGKKILQLQTNPPSEILFQCTLHFVALMPSLNCFGTCHKYWWNSFSRTVLSLYFLLSPSILFFLSPTVPPSLSKKPSPFCLRHSVILYLGNQELF